MKALTGSKYDKPSDHSSLAPEVAVRPQADMQIAKRQAAKPFDILSANINLKAALKHPLYDGAGKRLRLCDLFASQPHLSRSSSYRSSSSSLNSQDKSKSTPGNRRVLVIFIRHFFCGNCQEYLRRLSTHPMMSSDYFVQHNLSLVIIGCGAYTHINSYRALTELPNSWQLYSDPTSEIYRLLGMQRTLSLGSRAPKYIRQSLAGNMLRSVVQGVRRIPEGDVLGAGSWDVNGGEFLFDLQEQDAEIPGMEKWESSKLTWYHQMLNSRDHTEVEDLLPAIGLTQDTMPLVTELTGRLRLHTRTQSSPMVLEDYSLFQKESEALTPTKRRSSLRKSISIRRQTWMSMTTSLSRSMSLRVQ